MRNVRLVIEHEIRTTLAKRSFWITTFVLPLAIIAFTTVPQIVAQKSFATDASGPLAVMQGSNVVGYVDHAGIIQELPPEVPSDRLQAFADENAAQEVLAAGRILRYYVVPADFLQSGDMVLVDRQMSIMGLENGASLMEYVIDYNLVHDAALARLLVDPTPRLHEQSLAPEQRAGFDEDSPLSFIVPFAVMFILFFTITMSGGYMLQSVAAEKENRTAEVLLLSLRPVELMLGKVLGLGCVALLQMGIWLGGGYLAMNRGQSLLPAGANLALPPGFLVWTVLYFLLGYLLYSSALGALGALSPNVREGSQFTFFFLLPLMVPLWFNSTFIQAPNGLLATLLSLFPLTAPTSMVTRLVSTTVPLWQPVVGLLGLAITTYLLVSLAARFFRADTLLSDASLSWQRIAREIKTR